MVRVTEKTELINALIKDRKLSDLPKITQVIFSSCTNDFSYYVEGKLGAPFIAKQNPMVLFVYSMDV